MNPCNRPIGVFDSGVGGISVLREVRALLPQEDLIFYGDNAYAPYGTRPPEQVLDRAWAVAHALIDQGAKALLIACNTATSVAAVALRAELTMPVIGMEPALKPASLQRHGGSVLVMATPVTLGLPKFAQLMARYGEGAVPVPCPGLMEFAERGELSSDALDALLARLLGDWAHRPVDAVVLGCTHYVFLQEAIAKHFSPDTPLIDGNLGTARHLVHLLSQQGLLREDGHTGTITLETSGDLETVLPVMKRLLELPLSCERRGNTNAKQS